MYWSANDFGHTVQEFIKMGASRYSNREHFAKTDAGLSAIAVQNGITNEMLQAIVLCTLRIFATLVLRQRAHSSTKTYVVALCLPLNFKTNY